VVTNRSGEVFRAIGDREVANVNQDPRVILGEEPPLPDRAVVVGVSLLVAPNILASRWPAQLDSLEG
jgi:hypothetical protein